MKNILLLLLLTGLSVITCAQTITIRNQETKQPVELVTLISRSPNVYAITNANGQVNILAFKGSERIEIRTLGFKTLIKSYAELESANFELLMEATSLDLDEVVVSASRWEQNKSEVPNKITTIPVSKMRLLNLQTTADLIGSSDAVFVQKSQLGGGSPMIRGFATNRVLIVVDGVRMNNAIYREGNIQNVISIDPSALEATEIIFGPGATIYGSDAIGGVMDFHTKKALFTTGEKPYIKVDAFSRLSSANKEKTNHIDLNIGGKKIAFLTSITYSDFGNLKMGSNGDTTYLRKEYVDFINQKDSVVKNTDNRVQKFSGYNQINIMNKLRFKISENADLVFSNHYSRLSDVPRYDRLIQYKSGKLRYGDWYYGPQVWMMNSLQLTLSGKNRLYDEARIIASQQSYEESRHDRNFGKTTINEQVDKVGIASINLDFDKKFKGEKQLAYYGFEYVYNDIRSVAQTRDIMTGDTAAAGSRYPNGKNRYNSTSLYVGYKNNLSEKLTFNTGIRYNLVTLNSTIADNSFFNVPFTSISMSNGALTGAAGLVLRLKGKTQLNLNTSTGFRAPNLDDVGKIFDPVAGVVVVPNPDLKPEYAYNIDLGLSKDFLDFLHFDITGFYTWLSNAMIRHDFLFNGEDSIIYKGVLSRVQAITNATYARVYGVNLNIQCNIADYLAVKSSLNITKGKEKGDIPLRHAAPTFGTTHILLKSNKLNADLYANYNASRKFEDMPPTEIEKPYLYATDKNGKPYSPGWFTLNFKISYNAMKWAIINAGVENIFDKRYRPYSSGIVAPGRNFVISLRLII
jgi:hemoglobin/transferrin/lactoferrin receptor protein